MLLLEDWQRYLERRDEIESITDPRCYPILWIDAAIWSGNIALHTSPRAIIGTTIKTYPTGATELHGMFAAGELPEILTLIEKAESESDADFASIASRSGWQRVMRDHGYALHQVELRKDLR